MSSRDNSQEINHYFIAVDASGQFKLASSELHTSRESS